MTKPMHELLKTQSLRKLSLQRPMIHTMIHTMIRTMIRTMKKPHDSHHEEARARFDHPSGDLRVVVGMARFGDLVEVDVRHPVVIMD